MYIQGDEMSTKFKYSAAGILSAALAMPFAANATLFTFDPDGGGGAAPISNLALIDQTPGSAYAQGGVTAFNNFISGGPAAGNNFTLFYQANLNSILNSI